MLLVLSVRVVPGSVDGGFGGCCHMKSCAAANVAALTAAIAISTAKVAIIYGQRPISPGVRGLVSKTTINNIEGQGFEPCHVMAFLILKKINDCRGHFLCSRKHG